KGGDEEHTGNECTKAIHRTDSSSETSKLDASGSGAASGGGERASNWSDGTVQYSDEDSCAATVRSSDAVRDELDGPATSAAREIHSPTASPPTTAHAAATRRPMPREPARRPWSTASRAGSCARKGHIE